MFEQIREWLAPPVFANDEDKTRVASLLNTMLLLFIFIALAFIPLIYLFNTGTTDFDPLPLGLGLVTLASSLLLLGLSRRGQVQLSSIIISTIVLILVTLNAYNSGGIDGLTIMTFILVMAIASSLLGGRGTTVFTGLSLAIIMWLIYLGVQNQLPPPFPPNLAVDIAFIFTMFGLIGLLLRSTMNSLHRALTQGQESNAQLKALSTSLEERVTERTQAIALAARIGRRISQERDLNSLLAEAVELIQANFNLYHTQIYLTGVGGRILVLRASSGLIGQQLIKRNHRLIIGPSSINGTAAYEKRTIVVPDVTISPIFRPNPLLPDIRAEVSAPLLVGERVLGVLNLQSNQVYGLTEDSLSIFEILTGQLAIAIDNATLFTQIEQSQAIMAEQARRLTRQNWQEYLNAVDRPERLGYTYSLQDAAPTMDAAQTIQNLLFVTQIKILGEPVGTIQIENAPNQQWTPEYAQVIKAVADQIAQQVENLRLLDEADRFRLEAEAATRRLIREGWASYQQMRDATPTAFIYDQNEVHPLPVAVKGQNDTGTAIPLQIQGATIGQLRFTGVNETDENTNRFITVITEQLCAHLENLRLSTQTETALAQAQQRSEELTLVNNIVSIVSASLDLQHSLEIIVAELVQAIGIDQARIALLNDARTAITIIAEHFDDNRSSSVMGTAITIADNETIQKVLTTRQSMVITNAQDAPELAFIRQTLQTYSTHTLAILPMIVGNETIGIVILELLQEKGTFRLEQLRLAETIIFQAATAIQNAQLFEQVRTRARQEQILREVTAQVHAAPDAESILRTAAAEINRALGVEAFVYLDDQAEVTTSPTAG